MEMRTHIHIKQYAPIKIKFLPSFNLAKHFSEYILTTKTREKICRLCVPIFHNNKSFRSVPKFFKRKFTRSSRKYSPYCSIILMIYLEQSTCSFNLNVRDSLKFLPFGVSKASGVFYFLNKWILFIGTCNEWGSLPSKFTEANIIWQRIWYYLHNNYETQSLFCKRFLLFTNTLKYFDFYF